MSSDFHPPRRPEAELILRCCAASTDGSLAGAEDLITPDFDWAWFERAARSHGVVPLVAHQLASLDAGSGAGPMLTRLKTASEANALRNLYLTKTLLEILETFRHEGISTLALKGPVLATVAYGDSSLRSFSDLDIMVEKRDIPAAAKLLESRGFEPQSYDPGAFASDFFVANEAEFRRDDDAVSVDLHWRLLPSYYRFGPDGREVWERSAPVELEGVAVRTLAYDDLLLYVCVHASRHGWQTLGQVCDIAQLIRRAANLDWNTLLARAAATGSLRMLRIGLILACDLLGAPAPPAVIASARADRPSASVAASVGAAIAGPYAFDSAAVREFVLAMRAIEGVGRKARYFAIHMLGPTMADWEFWPLPRPLFAGYYFLRPIRIVTSTFEKIRKRQAAG
ncbi:MAG TPA: nucleotidyltransferase family protein [Candidatus Binataceae bacterium]|nr:nucleotidyltransferase family protein [Candidatus Binataceae bacterium]